MTTLKIIHRLAELDAAQWDAQAPDHLFVRHAYLSGLEESGSVNAEQGWQPCHLTLWEGEQLCGAMPLYLKNHSWGEFVFDWAWARAYEQHGLVYYPKLVAMVPFTPITGPRLWARDADGLQRLQQGALQWAEEVGASSLHILFPASDSMAGWQSQGLLTRQDVQFHWQNAGYVDFEHYLEHLQRHKRKNVRQELRRLQEHGFRFQVWQGDAIDDSLWAFAWRCYVRTYAVRGRQPYLTPDFWQYLRAQLAAHLVLVVALRAGQPVAMALNLRDGDTLYGRYWGTLEEWSGLHFATCYHESIRFAISEGIQRFEGGAQGEHKLARGLLPVTTHSLHWIAQPDFRAAIARHVVQESQGVGAYVDELNDHSPFRA
ncbi:GNAT family N-acetyltransferase [Leeia aquatica]|uniref:N-acetyltransferase n=1 Tax=Leeia aquatica TaxID=2725557 RepID=A0A847S2I9_9NEIS|nr:GNAT family N-acetyltransferase [Leeia aquatica]NLR76031.1 N-acetyltransferase [Leeia aquatica]